MDGRRHPALMIMPHELPAPGDAVVNRVTRRRPIDLRLCLPDTDGGDNVCHPGFFFSALGALRGTVVAKRF